MYSIGIVNGTEVNGQTVFDPQGTLTRSQAAAMLGRLLTMDAAEDEDETLFRADLSQFTDAGEIQPYALEHFQLLVGMGAIDGTGDGKLDPNGTMTRAVICKALSVLTDAY